MWISYLHSPHHRLAHNPTRDHDIPYHHLTTQIIPSQHVDVAPQTPHLAHTRRRTRGIAAMPSRKRAADEMETEAPVSEPSTLQRLRNMWEFANLAQYISLFGEAVKIDKDLDIEACASCAQPHKSCAYTL